MSDECCGCREVADLIEELHEAQRRVEKLELVLERHAIAISDGVATCRICWAEHTFGLDGFYPKNFKHADGCPLKEVSHG